MGKNNRRAEINLVSVCLVNIMYSQQHAVVHDLETLQNLYTPSQLTSIPTALLMLFSMWKPRQISFSEHSVCTVSSFEDKKHIKN